LARFSRQLAGGPQSRKTFPPLPVTRLDPPYIPLLPILPYSTLSLILAYAVHFASEPFWRLLANSFSKGVVLDRVGASGSVYGAVKLLDRWYLMR